MAQIEDVEGISPHLGAKLVSAGVKTTDALLERKVSARSTWTCLRPEHWIAEAKALPRVVEH